MVKMRFITDYHKNFLFLTQEFKYFYINRLTSASDMPLKQTIQCSKIIINFVKLNKVIHIGCQEIRQLIRNNTEVQKKLCRLME
jgi:hypothetical protein